MGKHHQRPFLTLSIVHVEPLTLIFCDIWGPSPLLSKSGARYCLKFLDAATQFTWIYFLKQNSQALFFFQQFKTMVENQLQRTIKSMQTDNAKEFLIFTKFFLIHGITHCHICPHTHEQNGSIE